MINRAKEIVRGDFALEAAGEADLTDTEQACVRAFNNDWDTKVYPLATQIRYLFINLFRASQYQPQELAMEPGLSICALIKDAKEKIDLVEHVKFVEAILSMSMDAVFNTPEAEVGDTV